MNLLIHEVKKAEDLFLKDGHVPDTISIDNSGFKNVLDIIKQLIECGDAYKQNENDTSCMRLSEDTTSGVHCIYTTKKKGTDHQNWEMTRMEGMCAK